MTNVVVKTLLFEVEDGTEILSDDEIAEKLALSMDGEGTAHVSSGMEINIGDFE